MIDRVASKGEILHGRYQAHLEPAKLTLNRPAALGWRFLQTANDPKLRDG